MKINFRKIILAVLCTTFFSGMSFAGQVIIDISKKTPANAGIRSMFFPGWGQVYNNQKTKGYIICGLALATFAYSSMLYVEADDVYTDYAKKGIKNDPLYSDYETKFNQAKNVSYFGIGIWVYSIIDALANGGNSQNNTVLERKNGFFLDYSRSGCSLTYTKKF
ncbi:MAG: DUF5683 domain-containing protein [Elusimicrobia bacterium]|nr:DUF5683 domain-containing protein [Candidatus Liberimonas magnetica]